MNEVIARLDYQAVLIIEFVLWIFLIGGITFVGIIIWGLFKDWVRGK